MNNQSTSKIIVRAQTVDEEFDYLFNVLKRMPFFNEHGYKIPIPDHPFFLKISNDLSLLDSVNIDEAKNIFKKEVYSFEYFDNGLKTIAKEVELAERALKIMGKWVKWGFKIFSKYEIRLTAYGPGGSYDWKKGAIIMKTNQEGTFRRRNPSHTIVHEIIHIGIEECIVEKFNLTHVEKEALVDSICVNCFDGLLAGYVVQDRGDKKVFNLVSKDNIMDLPNIICEYKNNFF